MTPGQLKFDLGTAALSQYDADGFLGISVDHYGDNAGGPPAEGHTVFGFHSRPSDPDVDQNAQPTRGCTVLYFLEGQRWHAMPLGDPRHLPPQLTKGGSVQYCAAAGAYAKFDGQSGAYSLAVPKGQSATFQAAGGPTVVMDANGLTVGGASAQALALGPALAALITALQAFAAGNCVNGAVLTSSVKFVADLQAITTYQTTTIKGT